MAFDCNAGYMNWVKGWSQPKKAWCCDHFPPVGCQDPSTFAAAIEPVAPVAADVAPAAVAAVAPAEPVIRNGYKLVGNQWVPLTTITITTTSTTPACLTAKHGDKCYSAVVWCKYTGLNLHPEWYPGIGPDSTLEQIQTTLHEKGEGDCYKPCETKTVLPPKKPWGKPSFFCFSVMRPGYEQQIMTMQVKKGRGIFSCDETRVFSVKKIKLGGVPEVETIVIPDVKVGVSQDGTAANTMTFMQVWAIVKADKTYHNHDFTVKADPDAVVICDKLRQHMSAHVNANIFVRNCNKFPGSPNFPMMYGAVEVLSRAAVDAYLANQEKCKTSLPWQNWGEDFFLGKCLQMLGVGTVDDFNLVKDGACSGSWCGDGGAAAFHPFKSVAAWESCWNQAAGAHPR